MTANLLTHSRLFATGIAMSGAYNRTLTPFGFQSEERTLWQAPGVYTEMSPFQHADQVAAPILLVHGQADNNPGTDPVQSERFYNAVKGLGGRPGSSSCPTRATATGAANRSSTCSGRWTGGSTAT
jgi:dipeptidyl aminopeptidase/acylaminoacyl peptidase